MLMSISMEPNFLPLPNFYIIKDQNEHFVLVYNSDRQQHYRITAKGENEEKKKNAGGRHLLLWPLHEMKA